MTVLYIAPKKEKVWIPFLFSPDLKSLNCFWKCGMSPLEREYPDSDSVVKGHPWKVAVMLRPNVLEWERELTWCVLICEVVTVYNVTSMTVITPQNIRTGLLISFDQILSASCWEENSKVSVSLSIAPFWNKRGKAGWTVTKGVRYVDASPSLLCFTYF